MKKVSTAAVKTTKNFSQPKLTIGLDLGDRNSWYCVVDLHKTHVLLDRGFGDRFRIDEIVLVRLAVRLRKLRRDESHLMSLLAQHSTDEVRSAHASRPISDAGRLAV